MEKVKYEFYRDTYSGTLVPEKSWNHILIKTESYLRNLMHQEPDSDNLDLVQLCICEASELIYQDEINKQKTGGREVQSENTDGYSVTYATEAEAGKIAVNSLQTKVYAVIQRYLSSTGLLYMGVEYHTHECRDHYF